jgi:putative ABC transport system permease protein
MLWLLRRLVGPQLAENILGDLEEQARVRFPNTRLRRTIWIARETAGVALSVLAQRGRTTRREPGDRAGASFLESLVQDGVYGLRQLKRSPLFTAAAVLTLGLAIGANSALFAVANAVLLRPLPYPDSDRLVSITVVSQKGVDLQRMDEPTGVLAMTTGVREFQALALYDSTAANFLGGTEPEHIAGGLASEPFFRVMGIPPAFGRTFVANEFQPGGPKVVVLSDGLWARAFGRRLDLLGDVVTLDDQSYRVVGIMPRDFIFPGRAEFWIPLFPRVLEGGLYYRNLIGRLTASSSTEGAQQAFAALRRAHEATLPQGALQTDVRVVALHERLNGQYRNSLVLLWGVVGCVLLIACANVANLQLARSSTRRRELAVRAAIGASQGRLVRQMLAESVLLACLGAVPGLALAAAGLRAFEAFGPAGLTRIVGEGFDSELVGFTLATTLGTGILFGLAPALVAGRSDPHASLRDGRLSSGRTGPWRALVTFQLAAAVVLTIGAALLAKSFVRFQAIDRGFVADNVLTASISLPRTRYADEPRRRAFFEHVVERLQAISTVESVSAAPVGLGGMQVTFNWPHKNVAAQERAQVSLRTDVDADFFRTYGVPIRAGTSCAALERMPTAVVNERMARLAFPGRSAVGEQLDLGEQGSYTVVGVAGNVRRFDTNQMPLPTIYGCASPADASPHSGVIAVRVRNGVDAMTVVPALREAVRSADPNQPISNITSVSEMVAAAVTSRWFEAGLVVAFAGVAVVIAILGLYALMAYTVARRTYEIGLRLAIGATRMNVIRLVLRQGVFPTSVGVAVGLAGSVPLVGLLQSMIFEVDTLDVSVFMAVAALSSIVAMVAVAIPAVRAARVDPIQALRVE